MPPAAQALAPKGFAVDHGTYTISFTRAFEAAPEQVFAAWTQPQQVERWWDPSGEPLARCEIDLQVGGRFTFVSEGHPEMPFSGTYREINSPTSIVFDAMGAIGTVTIAASATGSTMEVAIRCTDAEHLAKFVEMGVADGTSQTLDNLAEHLSGER